MTSAMVTTMNSGAVYSPVVDSARKIGRNAAEVVSEEMSSGKRSSRAEPTAASTAGRPSSICTMMDSAMTMALSTSIPRAMMSAASDIWSSPIPRNDITSSEPTIVTGTRLATTRPVRSPRKRSITPSTTPTAWSRFERNSRTLASTISGWNATTSNSMPIGYAAWSRPSSSATASPSRTTLPPSRIATASASAGTPEA